MTQIRALDIPEADILNFISDSLYGRMHSRGGPKDMNEVRMRAAKILLSLSPRSRTKCPTPARFPQTTSTNTKTAALVLNDDGFGT